MKTILLLICSNIFMTIAWYGHLKYRKALLLTLVVVSCMVASAPDPSIAGRVLQSGRREESE
jgi:hypothetical protein